MSIDREKGVQWVIMTTPEAPVVPVTVVKRIDGQNIPPEIIYSGTFNADIVPALAQHGYIYNYSPDGSGAGPDSFLLYSTNKENSYLLIIADEISITEVGLAYTSNEFQNKLIFNSGSVNCVTNAFTLQYLGDPPVLSLDRLDQPYNGASTAIECYMTNAVSEPEEPLGPDILLISNPTQNHFGAKIGIPSTVVTLLNGPQGGSSEIENGIFVCLAPIQPVVSSIEGDTTKCVKMEGLFAIEINGEMVPYHFSEEDLPKFFNATNPYGIQFIDCNASIRCVPSSLDFDWVNRENIDGDWALEFSFDDGPIMRWEQSDVGMTDPQALFREAMRGVSKHPNAVGTLVNGGTGNFYYTSNGISGARGGAIDTPIKLTFHRMTDEFGGVDLFDWFFDLNGTMQSLDIMSCGEQEWPGV